jgi:hypothetical protein
MFRRLLSVLAVSTGLLYGCDCIEMPSRQALHGSEAVFLGTVSGFRDSSSNVLIVVFQVDRVWKGRIKQTFEMPALTGASCLSFAPSLLQIGNQLIVYASRLPSGVEYFPVHCNTKLATIAEAAKNLGPGRKANSK